MKQWIKRHKRMTIILLILLALNIWDFADPPLWWQFGAQDNKRAILAYVNEKYPGAKIIRQSYHSTRFNPTNVSQDVIVFQYDDVQFAVAAHRGRFAYDGFSESKAANFIVNEYINKFFGENLAPPHQISFVGEPCDDLSEYTGSVTLFLRSSKKEGYNKPSDMTWAYDFFVFWKENCIIPQYVISITLNLPNDECYIMKCNQNSIYLCAEEFYDAFKHYMPTNTNLNQQQ